MITQLPAKNQVEIRYKDRCVDELFETKTQEFADTDDKLAQSKEDLDDTEVSVAAIAMQKKLDVFVRVKQAIDDMNTQLTAEKQDELKHKDRCVVGFNTNQVQTERIWGLPLFSQTTQ